MEGTEGNKVPSGLFKGYVVWYDIYDVYLW